MDVNKRIEFVSYAELYSEIYLFAKEFKNYGYYFDSNNSNAIIQYSEAIAKGLQKSYQFFTWGEVKQIFTGCLNGSIDLVEKKNNTIAKFTPENFMRIFSAYYKTAINKQKAQDWDKKRELEMSQMFNSSFHGKAVLYRLNICRTKPELKKDFTAENAQKNGYQITTSMIAECLENGINPEILINN